MADEDVPVAPPLPPELGGLIEQDFLDWRHHPMTKVYRRFLEDYREVLRRTHTERWEKNPEIDIAYEAEARGRVLTIGEMHDLEFDDLVAFYQEPPKQEEADEAAV